MNWRQFVNHYLGESAKGNRAHKLCRLGDVKSEDMRKVEEDARDDPQNTVWQCVFTALSFASLKVSCSCMLGRRTISGCRWKVARANPCTTYRRTARPIRNTPLSKYSLLLNSESHSTMLSELACPSRISRHDLASSCHGSCPRCVVQFLVMVHCPYTESQ
ncbi:hypothetical protein OH76DRAFT_1206651 [Lentinus brumalis]|uniref:Uncharacterized protein n=1 Tax=Lentinus brumalis TaxID=2498619 RepID=A0A371CSV9_9APHY|nr:hypothetical protein OH76DRAFT_1206651 [Polyporus brumalis]